jgi:hypothetical protein
MSSMIVQVWEELREARQVQKTRVAGPDSGFRSLRF